MRPRAHPVQSLPLMKRLLLSAVLLLSGCGGQKTQTAEPRGSYELVALQCGDSFVPLDGVYSERITIDENGIGTIEQKTPTLDWDTHPGCEHTRDIAVAQHGDELVFTTTETMCRDPRRTGESTCSIVFPIDERRRMVQSCDGRPSTGKLSWKDGVLTAVMKPTEGAFSCKATYARAE